MADFDLVIVGGGPAGLTAGLYAARANMNAILFDQKGTGGEILNTDLIEDYPGFESVTGRDLADKMAAHAVKFGLKIEIKGVRRIRSDGDDKLIEMEDGTTHRALAVIVTVGGEPIKLQVPGEEEYHGRGVSYCAVCDGAFFRGVDLAVIGGGDSAFQEGLFLTRFAKKLYVVHRRNEFKAQAILQDRLLGMEQVQAITPAVVKEIGGNGDVKWIDVERDGKVERVPVEGVFIFVGFRPLGRELFAEHIAHDGNGYLITDAYMRTSIPGVYAAGDCRQQLAKQITTAVGDATTAVLHAERYIEELKHARAAFPTLEPGVAARTATRFEAREVMAGETIIREGDPSDRLYIVTSGEVGVFRREAAGGETEVRRLGAGQIFGEIGLMSGVPRTATVRALSTVTLLALDRSGFSELVASSAAAAEDIARLAGERGQPVGAGAD